MIRARAVVLALLFVPLAAERAMAHPGWGIVVDRGGNVYYTDLAQVWKIGKDGKKTVAVPDVHTHELALDEAGGLHGEHLWYDGADSKWRHYAWGLVDGKVVRHPPQEGFRSGDSLVRDRSGASYWLEGSTIRKRAPDGPIVDVATVPRRPDPSGREPGGTLAVGADGSLYLVSTGELWRVDPDGTIARMASGLDERVWTAFMIQPWHSVLGLSADAGGNVYVANTGARTLKKVSRGGAVSVVLRARFPWAPTGVAIHDGNLYVLEYKDTGGSVRVRKLAPNGRVTVLP